MSVQTFYAHKVEAPHAPNGGPQRGWLIYNAEAAYRGFADDAYRGRMALARVADVLAGKGTDTELSVRSEDDGSRVAHGPNGTVRVIEMGAVSVSKAEYRRLVKQSQTESFLTAF